MRRSPSFQFYAEDFLVGTADMRPEEVGGYIRLLCYQWAKGSLPDDDRKLCALAGVKARTLIAIKVKFEACQDGQLCNPRLEKVRVDQEDFRLRQAENGSIKWGSSSSNKGKRHERLRAARAKGTHTPMEWNALVSFCGNKCCRCGEAGSLVKDHIVPIYVDGSDGISNLQPLCNRCNSSKGPEQIDHRPQGWENACRDACENSNKRLPDAYSPSPSPSPSPVPPLIPNADTRWWPEVLRNDTLFRLTWEQWEQHCQEKGKTILSRARMAQLTQCATYGSARAMQVIQQSIQKNWGSLVWDYDDKPHGNHSKPNSRNANANADSASQYDGIGRDHAPKG